MKALLFFGAIAIHGLAFTQPQQSDSTGLAGDHFSLRGALEVFRQSKDLESFEQSLNAKEQRVNNLDLDGNGEVDYVHVRTHADGDARVIVLQVALGKEDLQDVAAIEMEKTGEGVVLVQIRGDEVLYPENTIVEPMEEARENGGKRGGPSMAPMQVTVWVNVWAWPSVQWCYGPMWWEWSSPWYWGYYPPWWQPWSPWGWSMWWGFPRPYWGWYHHAPFCRVTHAHGVYAHRRSISATVQRRDDVRRQMRPAIHDARPMDKGDQPRGTDRTKPSAPGKQPDARPPRKPTERAVPSKPPQRTAPPSKPPTRQPGKAPGKR